VGSGGECHTRITLQDRRTGTWGAAGDEDAPTGAAARMGSSEATAGKALTAEGAVVAAGSFPAGVELAPSAWSCPVSEGVSCKIYS
jgi:hypothetical protein